MQALPALDWNDQLVVYRWSAWRYLGSMIAIGLVGSTIGWLVAFLLWSALVRRLGSSELIGGIAYVVLYTLFFATFSLLLTWRRPTRPDVRRHGRRTGPPAGAMRS